MSQHRRSRRVSEERDDGASTAERVDISHQRSGDTVPPPPAPCVGEPRWRAIRRDRLPRVALVLGGQLPRREHGDPFDKSSEIVHPVERGSRIVLPMIDVNQLVPENTTRGRSIGDGMFAGFRTPDSGRQEGKFVADTARHHPALGLEVRYSPRPGPMGSEGSAARIDPHRERGAIATPKKRFDSRPAGVERADELRGDAAVGRRELDHHTVTRKATGQDGVLRAAARWRTEEKRNDESKGDHIVETDF